MAVLRAPVLRHILGESAPYLRGSQRRWAQVHDIRFVATHRQPDRIIEKYKEKLDKKAKEAGVKDIKELKEVYKSKIQDLKKAASTPLPTPNQPSSTYPYPQPPPPPRITADGPSAPFRSPIPKPSSPPGIKTLSSYLDIPKTLSLPPKEIEYIWRLRHVNSPQSLCATVPSDIYTRIEATARRHPQFILPLPRENAGAEIHFLQWTFPTSTTTTVLFTHLAEYKLRGEFSQPHTTITHHLDLAQEKGLVLLQGSVAEGRGISVEEGRWLVMCLRRFYGEVGERRKLLEMFSQGNEEFRVERLVEEAEKIV